MLAHPVLPFVGQLVDRASVNAGECAFEARILPDVVVQLENAPLAVAFRQEPVDAPADRVHEPAVGVRQIGQRRQPPRDRHVAQHHLVAAVLARREELGQPFGPPQRHPGLPEARVPSERLRRETQLEDVHQLVTDRMPEFGVVAAERQRDATLQKLRDPQQPFGRDERQDVGLLEIAVRCVHDQRDAPRDGVVEAPLERVVARLGVRQRHAAQLFFFGIVVEVDVLAAQDAPVKPAVLDLVLPEVAVLGG